VGWNSVLLSLKDLKKLRILKKLVPKKMILKKVNKVKMAR